MRDVIPKLKKPRAAKKDSPRVKQPETATIIGAPEAPIAPPHNASPDVSAEISWFAPEYRHYPKNKDWFWTIGFVSVILVILALIFRNFLFAIFVALAGFVFALFSARRPRTVRFVISAKGVLVNRTIYPYQHLKSFWIFYEPAGKKALSIESRKTFMPFITIPLGDVDPASVRAYLKRFLKEAEHEESIAEQISEHVGF